MREPFAPSLAAQHGPHVPALTAQAYGLTKRLEDATMDARPDPAMPAAICAIKANRMQIMRGPAPGTGSGLTPRLAQGLQDFAEGVGGCWLQEMVIASSLFRQLSKGRIPRTAMGDQDRLFRPTLRAQLACGL